MADTNAPSQLTPENSKAFQQAKRLSDNLSRDIANERADPVSVPDEYAAYFDNSYRYRDLAEARKVMRALSPEAAEQAIAQQEKEASGILANSQEFQQAKMLSDNLARDIANELADPVPNDEYAAYFDNSYRYRDLAEARKVMHALSPEAAEQAIAQQEKEADTIVANAAAQTARKEAEQKNRVNEAVDVILSLDGNKDVRLNSAELAAFKSDKEKLAKLDVNGDGKVTAKDIEEIYGPGAKEAAKLFIQNMKHAGVDLDGAASAVSKPVGELSSTNARNPNAKPAPVQGM